MSYDNGNEPLQDGTKYPIPLSFDAQWLKPGRAHNAPDGYGVGIGGLTRKVVISDYKTKVGPLKNHEGSSGSMEPAMGAEICRKLAAQHGTYVNELCMDLDAKTPKAVREMCEREALPFPEKIHDPNHFVKVAKGKFIDVKAKIKMKNCFPPATQLRLAQQFAMWRCTKTASRVILSSLGAPCCRSNCTRSMSTSNCPKYFKCPVASGKRTSSTYKDGLWLNVAGGEAAGIKLREALPRQNVR